LRPNLCFCKLTNIVENGLFFENPNLLVGQFAGRKIAGRNPNLLVGNRNLLVGNHIGQEINWSEIIKFIGQKWFDVYDSKIKWLPSKPNDVCLLALS
jgi:hypothetical protein